MCRGNSRSKVLRSFRRHSLGALQKKLLECSPLGMVSFGSQVLFGKSSWRAGDERTSPKCPPLPRPSLLPPSPLAHPPTFSYARGHPFYRGQPSFSHPGSLLASGFHPSSPGSSAFPLGCLPWQGLAAGAPQLWRCTSLLAGIEL